MSFIETAKVGEKLYCTAKRQMFGVEYGDCFTVKTFKRFWVETYTGDSEMMGVQFEETGDSVYLLEHFSRTNPRIDSAKIKLDEELFTI